METRYPSAATIAAFGGTAAAGRILGHPKSTIHRWKVSVSGCIPRWHSAEIEAAAAKHGLKLPRPRRLNGGKRRAG